MQPVFGSSPLCRFDSEMQWRKTYSLFVVPEVFS